jgi:glycylpeptide N-tetradecanoyltransferase
MEKKMMTYFSEFKELQNKIKLGKGDPAAIAKRMDEIQNSMRLVTEAKQVKPMKEYKFWSTQPVLPFPDQQKDGQAVVAEGTNEAIEKKKVSEISKDPYPLPEGFEWSVCNLDEKDVLEEVYNLLSQNYVEDDHSTFRFDYSREFLHWAVQPPGFFRDWHVGVRATTGKKKLYGFITGIPVHMQVFGKQVKMCEINFLCVHKALRSKRLAPQLIKEITRRVNLQGIWQAVYTAGVVLPKPVTAARYFHRSLNPKKLIDIGFSRIPPHCQTLAKTIQYYKVEKTTSIKGIRPLRESDCKQACKLLNDYLKTYKLYQQYTVPEFRYVFMSRPLVIYSYVVEDKNDANKITDFLSFYCITSSVIDNKNYKSLLAAYSYYSVANTVSLNALMSDALVLASQEGCDVFNCLNVMQNDEFINDLKFGKGDGFLKYYLYNWKCAEIQPKECGLVLL